MPESVRLIPFAERMSCTNPLSGILFSENGAQQEQEAIIDA